MAKNQKTKLAMEIVKKLKILTDGKTKYVLLKQPNSRSELTPVPSSEFSTWLTYELYEKHKETCTPQVERQISAYLVRTAKTEVPVEIHRRFGFTQDKYCIDIGSHANNDMITISEEKWAVEQPEKTDAVFLVDDNLSELAKPSKNNNPFNLAKFLNIRDRKHLMMVLAWVCAVPLQINHPILLLQGAQASGKTTAARLLRKIFDASESLIMSVPQSDSELALAFFKNSICLFDNMGKISDNCADIFCKAVTGDGFAKRKLYTDSEQIIYKYKRPIIITTIGNPTERSDFQSRCMLVPMPTISTQNTQDSSFIEKQFNEELPEIMGGLLDLLVKGLQLRKYIRLNHKTRMSDFDRIGCGIALALGYDPAEFMEARFEDKRKAFFVGPQETFLTALDQLVKESGGEVKMNAKDLAKDMSARSNDFISEKSIGTKLSRTREQLKEANITYTKARKSGVTEYVIKSEYPSKDSLVEVVVNCRTCKHLNTELVETMEYCDARKGFITEVPEGRVTCQHYALNLKEWEIDELCSEYPVIDQEPVDMDAMFGSPVQKEQNCPAPPPPPVDDECEGLF